jgi:D-methionine transport system ATP-binding protein
MCRSPEERFFAYSQALPETACRFRVRPRVRATGRSFVSMTAASSSPPTGDLPVIRLRDVRKSFALPDGTTFDAVHSLSLDIRAGDVFGLIGKSGAGKSTLLRLINLLERPDAGQVVVGGRDLMTLSRRELRETRQTLGMIFQQFNLIQNATVADNVAFPLKIHGRHSRAEIAERVRECLRLVGLEDKAGGQKQRVAIARALAPRPQVLLCDEPTSALDSETTRELLQTLRDINRTLGVTVVIVTHELSVVEALCRNVAILERGELIEQFAVDAPLPAAGRLTVLGREIDALVRRRERDAREALADESRGAVDVRHLDVRGAVHA